MRIVATLALILLAAPACSPTIDVRGNLPNPDQLVLVKPGDVNRDDVANMLGTPSSTAVFDDETWYYISMRTETKTFFKPKVLERRVVAVRFDPKGMVKDVRTYTLDDGREIKPIDRETPTAGNEMTFLEQMFGNVGKFSSQKDSRY
ncbi:MAG: outer membrane protein assembly factor BamE [Rhodospirillales bacterium]|nr:outer membrane protein assembly factor BamE [Rhodospirillales bacterium]